MERHQDKFLCTFKCHWRLNILLSLYPCLFVCCSSLLFPWDKHTGLGDDNDYADR